MIKKIIRIILCIVSFFGFSLTVLKSASEFPSDAIFDEIASGGTGITATKYIALTSSPTQQPFTYINLPKSTEQPIALSIYDSFPVLEEQGQDSPAEPDTQPDTPKTHETPPEDTPSLPADVFPVIGLDMSENQTSDSLACKNESKYSPDVNTLSRAQYPLSYTKTVSTNSEALPLVLIIHTHGTECYLPDNTDTYTADTPTRTQDTTNNVVAVGKILAQKLNQKGVPTIHCETMFDAESYSESYNLSEKQVMEYLEQYPSIQYVFDVHRDSIVNNNNEKFKPVTQINGNPTAQAMFVVGTDSSGADHPNWINNLTVASIFQSKLIEKYKTIMRPINIRSASFNAEHAPGSLLIEIGTCGNTITEAKNCAEYLGETIADIILNDGNI